MSTKSRYVKAVSTGRSDTRGVGETVAAAGLASRRIDRVSMALLRWHAGDRRLLKSILQMCREKVMSKAYRECGWEMPRDVADRIAMAVLSFAASPGCAQCGGRGEVANARGVMGPCQACEGTGQGKLSFDGDDAQRRLAEWLAAEIDRAEAIANAALSFAAGSGDNRR